MVLGIKKKNKKLGMGFQGVHNKVTQLTSSTKEFDLEGILKSP